MLKTEMINPKTVNIDKMDTLSMIDIINEENMNAVKAVQAESANIALAIDAFEPQYICTSAVVFLSDSFIVYEVFACRNAIISSFEIAQVSRK